jgi:DNA-binding beta-propeller fold protein YncE
MSRTEERLIAALSQTAALVREEALRPLAVPPRGPRRWPRIIAPAAAAVAVVTVLGIDVAIGRMAPAGPAGATTGAAPTVRTGGHPGQMALDGAASTLYVSTGATSGLAMINTATCHAGATSGCARVGHAPTGGAPVGVAVDERTRTVYALNAGPLGTLAVINADACNATIRRGCRAGRALVRLPEAPNTLAVNPRDGTLYVTYLRSSHLSVIDTRACRGTDTSGCGTAVTTVTAGIPPFFPSIAVDPASNTLYLGRNHDLAVIDGRACNAADVSGCGHIVAKAPVDGLPQAITADPATGTLYVGAPAASGLTVIDQHTCNALDPAGCARRPVTVKGGPGPLGGVADQGAHTVYVADENNAVAMIDPAACGAASAGRCPPFPASFPAGSNPQDVAADPAMHTVYVANASAGTLSVINDATCNAADLHGCPARPPAGTPRSRHTPYTCDAFDSAYVSGQPAGRLTRVSVLVASGSAGGHRWSVWARKGTIDPYGIEQGGVVVNGRWYALCDQPLSAGPGAGVHLIDAGRYGIVYGFIQHPRTVRITLASSGTLPAPVSRLLSGTTFFISELPRSACSYRSLTLKASATAGPAWSGTSHVRFGPCVAGQLASVASGGATWGPGAGH